MHRAALRVPLRQAIASQRRSFVSTVLLTKAWENETVAELRKEARKRGLSSTGNKANLITRLQEDEKKKAFTTAPTSVAPQSRAASTSSAPSSTPGTESATEVPGIPSTAEPTYPKFNLDTKLPDISQDDPEPPVAIPFVPDLWNSSKLKHESAPPTAPPSTAPKLVVIGGEATHSGSNVYTASSSPSPDSVLSVPRPQPKSNVGKLFADMADDLGLPTTLKLPSSDHAHFDAAAKTETSGGQEKSYSRKLDGEEKTGVYVLLGVFAASLVAGGVFAPVSEWAHKVEVKTQDVQEKTVGKKA
ncbi:hypothetical protein BD309DRAFT_1075457 [Dichomitus squalens]|nr:hypothetical protein BD309DRAFT_1075457 [Dichomitus squalens]